MANFVPLSGWPQIKDIPDLQGRLDRIKKIEAWKADTSYIEETGAEIEIDNCLGVPVNKLTATIAPTQEGSGTPSPDNVRPITGISTATVQTTDANLFDGVTYTENRAIQSDGSIATAAGWLVTDYLPCDKGGTFAYHGLTSVGVNPHSAWYDSNKSLISTFKQAIGDNTPTIPNGAKYVRFTVNNSDKTTFVVGAVSSITNQLGQTVYGGTINFNTGVLTVTHAIVDMGDLTYEDVEALRVDGIYPFELTERKTNGDFKCSAYNAHINASTWSAIANGEILSVTDQAKLRIQNADYITVSDIKTALSGVQLVYELATPTSLTLTPDTLTMLRGSNTVTTNCETITIKALTGRTF